MTSICHSNNPLNILTDEALKGIIENYDRDWLAYGPKEVLIYHAAAVAACAMFIERNGFDPRTGEVVDHE